MKAHHPAGRTWLGLRLRLRLLLLLVLLLCHCCCVLSLRLLLLLLRAAPVVVSPVLVVLEAAAAGLQIRARCALLVDLLVLAARLRLATAGEEDAHACVGPDGSSHASASDDAVESHV